MAEDLRDWDSLLGVYQAKSGCQLLVEAHRHRICTDRLFIRPFDAQDDVPLRHLLADERITNWFPETLRDPNGPGFRAWIDVRTRQIQLHTHYHLAIELGPDGVLVGGLSFDRSTYELSFWLATAYWGCGYATESVRAFIEILFRTKETPRVWARTHRDNVASNRVLEKAGFRFERFGHIQSQHGIETLPVFEISLT